MTDPGALALASSYVAVDGPTFWDWDEGGQVVAWAAGGGTIAFAPELALTLARVAPQGLPSFQAIVLLLAACREGWLEAADASFARVVAALEGTGGPAERLVPLLARALGALTTVTRLPAPLRAGPDARAVLVEVVLEGAPRRVGPDLAPAVAAALEGGALPARVDALAPRADALAADLEALAAGLEGRELEGLAALLEARRRTGLDAPPRPAPVEVEEPPALRVARLLDALEADPELGPLARLARDLRAAVHVPRAVVQDDGLPLGGVSDITNRGPLDRLLVSELAHDDETFVVRVATGEALFLRREAPPRGPEGGRALLVDGGVRLWGVARVFATAVALAAAAGAGRRAVAAFSPRRGALAPLDLTTREGLLAHLEALDPTPHPGAALAAFVERAGAEGERLLVTHEDALDDLRPALDQAARRGPLLVATVARDGAYRLRAFTARGAKPLSQARLDLRALLEPPRPAAPPLAGEARAPAIFALRPLPLRLPAAFDPARAFAHPFLGVVAATGDGRLLWFQPPLGHGGAIELTDQLPAGPLAWLEVDDEGEVGALVGPSAGEVTLVRTSLETPGAPARRSRAPCAAPPLAVVRRGPALLLVQPRHVDVLAFQTGAPAPGLELPAGVSWRMGRFFTDDRGWLALGADGLRPALEPLSGYPRRALALWDRHLREGPWAIEADGSLLSGAPVARIERLGEGDAAYAGVGAISSDGERLLTYAVAVDAMTLEVHDVETGAGRTVDPPPGARLDPRSLVEPALGEALAGAPQVRTRLGGLAVGGRGELVLVSRRRRLHALELGLDGGLRLRSLHPGEARLSAWRSFQAREPYAGAGWALSVAAWSDGSRAFLDGRGLLHLVPAKGVEVTLVLAEGPLAAWTSAGELVGPRYFTGVPGGDVPRAAAEAVLEHVARFCEGIR